METKVMKVKDLIEQLLKLNQETELEVGTTAGRMPLKEIKSFTDKDSNEHIILMPFEMGEM